MRVALYARYSSDLQNARSADDQLDQLRAAVKAKSWTEAAAYKDEAISGATIMTRPGLVRLLADAEQRRFDVVFAEALDRLSRGQADVARLFELLSWHGVRIETLSGGPVTELHIGLEGTMNRLFLVELAKKTRRGLVGRVNAGFSGGGHCFGYDVAGKGVLVVNDAQAQIVRRIFAEYDQGHSPRQIARMLNKEGVPGPRGGEWTAASINGDHRVGDGILHQALYRGERVFNRRRFRKNPETGKRSSVINPESDWVRAAVPDLRLLDDDLWERVQARKRALSEVPQGHRQRPRRVLSGLMSCATCGGSMTLQGRDRYACSSHRERGTCDNGKMVSAETVERRVLDGVRNLLLAPDAVESAMRAYERELKASVEGSLKRRNVLERELADVKGRIGRSLDLYEREMIGLETFRDRMA
jgi:DNA invertase Pin-like site-specific DNA recombinase